MAGFDIASSFSYTLKIKDCNCTHGKGVFRSYPRSPASVAGLCLASILKFLPVHARSEWIVTRSLEAASLDVSKKLPTEKLMARPCRPSSLKFLQAPRQLPKRPLRLPPNGRLATAGWLLDRSRNRKTIVSMKRRVQSQPRNSPIWLLTFLEVKQPNPRWFATVASTRASKNVLAI